MGGTVDSGEGTQGTEIRAPKERKSQRMSEKKDGVTQQEVDTTGPGVRDRCLVPSTLLLD